jgi:hypothetical protein
VSERVDGLTPDNYTDVDDFAGPWIAIRWKIAFWIAKHGPPGLRPRAESELSKLHVRMRLRARQLPFHMKVQEIAAARQLGVFTSAEAFSRIMIEFGRIIAAAREYPDIPEVDAAIASMRSAVKRCCRVPAGLERITERHETTAFKDRPRGTGTTRELDVGGYVPPEANPEWLKGKTS